MINSIMDGITNKLDEVFGYTIYGDDIKQGYEEPCFYVSHIRTRAVDELGTRKKLNSTFDIHFFGENTRQLREVEQEFYNNFSLISLPDGLIHGTDLNTEIVDGVLHCYVNYNMIVDEIKEQKFMEEMEINYGRKERRN